MNSINPCCGLEQKISYNSSSFLPPENNDISYSALECECAQPIYSGSFIPSLQNNEYEKSAGYKVQEKGYTSQNKKQETKQEEKKQEIIFNPNSFLNPLASSTQFVGQAFEIKEIIEQAFRATTGMYLPNDMIIELVSKQDMFNTTKNKGVTGFCINRKGFSQSNIFVTKGQLDAVMLTIGHEIGHALTMPLINEIDEEAKAFAFSLAWMQAIRKHDIGGLAANILPNPAKNGIHNIAFDFVKLEMDKGKSALDIFRELATCKLRCKK